MKLFERTPSVEAAEKALSDAEEVLARWTAETEAKAAELAHLQSRAGEDLLADPEAAVWIAGQVVKLGAEQDVARRAVIAATARLEAARRGLLNARAGELRGRAARLRRAAESRQKRTDELLALLSEHEGGATFHPWVPDCQFGGAMASIQAGAMSYKLPLTQVIASRADLLEKRAVELDWMAENGAGEQVAVEAAQPMPEPHVLDREFAGVR